MSELDLDGVENGNAAASTGTAKIPENWPTVKEMESVLNCAHCNRTASYPFMQCAEGHLICEDEGKRMENCPCGAALLRLRLRWYKLMAERASYACPIKDCMDTIVGQKDKGNHLLLSHESEEQFAASVGSSICNQAEHSSDESEQSNLAEMFEFNKKEEYPQNVTMDIITEETAASSSSSSEFLQSKESRAWTTPTKASVSATVKIPGFSTVLRGLTVWRGPEYQYSGSEQYDLYDEMVGGTGDNLHGPVVEEYTYSSAIFSPRNPSNDKKYSEESIYGYEDVSEDEELGELFRLSLEEEQMYYKNKCDIDQYPEHWSKIIRGDRRKIPLDAIHRELCIIKKRAKSGKPYKEAIRPF